MADRDINVVWGTVSSPQTWSRVTAQYIRFAVTPTLVADGSPATITGVQVSLLPYRSRGPDALTTWTNATWTAGVGAAPGTASVVVQGPDATITTASPLLTIASTSGGADLWARITDTPEALPQFICRIDLQADPRALP